MCFDWLIDWLIPLPLPLPLPQDRGKGRGAPPVNFALHPTTDYNEQEERMTTNEDWPRRLTTMAKKTDHEERWPQSIFTTSTTPAPSDDAACSSPLLFCVLYLCAIFDLWERARVHLLTYKVECEFEWKFPIVLADVNTLWDKFSVKRRVCMHILTHETMTVCAVLNKILHSFIQRDVSTKLYQLRHMKTCTFSLKRHVSAPFWLTMTCPCPTFNIRGHDGAETFHCFDHRIGPLDAFTVKRRRYTQLFDLWKHVYVQQISYHTMFFSTSFPLIHLNSHTTTWLYNLKSFGEID